MKLLSVALQCVFNGLVFVGLVIILVLMCLSDPETNKEDLCPLP